MISVYFESKNTIKEAIIFTIELAEFKQIIL